MTDSTATASSGDGSTGSTSTAVSTPASYSWIYDKDTDTFGYQPFDNDGNRMGDATEIVSVSDVGGTEGTTFNDGDTVVLYRPTIDRAGEGLNIGGWQLEHSADSSEESDYNAIMAPVWDNF